MSHVLRNHLFRSLLVVLACVLFTSVVFAQSGVDGAIGGTITDPSKAVVPNAKVTIRNLETNASFAASTDDQGKYRVQRLQPGTYSVTVEAANFGARTEPKVVVEVGRLTGIDLVLTVAGTKEVVEVAAEAPAINTIQQDFTSNINQTTINELPINGRRWSNFALLSPAATPDGGFGLISFRGISGLLNNSTVDGGDNNQAFFSEERGRTRISYVVSQASVREFQVNTSNYSAEYGRAAGGVVNSVTKSGTNSIHGSAFYYIRDNALGATNPFSIQTTRDATGTFVQNKIKSDDRRQQFGGSVGGPIIKDRFFYFFTYDQQKRNYPGIAQAGTPGTLFAPLTVATGLPAGIVCNPASGVTQRALTESETAFCRGVTQTQVNAGLKFLADETGIVPRKGDQTIVFPKIDWVINSKHTAAFSYNRMRWSAPAGVQSQPVVNRGIASFGDDFVKVDSFIARLSSALSTSVANELRYSWGRDFEFQNSQPNSAAEQAALTLATRLGPLGRFPSVAVAGSDGITVGKPNFLERTKYPEEFRNQVANNTSIARGKHLIKFGADVSKVNDTMEQLFQEGGAYSYSTRVDFLSDYANLGNASATRYWNTYNQGFGPRKWNFSTWDISFYGQDDFRILPRLTLNLGLRYEYQRMPDPQVANPLLPQTSEFPNDKNNFGPRFGFAWDVFGDSKTAVRGGYGIYYGRIANSTISSAINSTGLVDSTGNPLAQIQINYPKTDAAAPRFPNVAALRTNLTSYGDVVVFAKGAQNPQIHQVDLVIEREVAKNTVVSASYLGSFGRQLANFYDMNVPAASTVTKALMVGGPFDGQYYETPFYGSKTPTGTTVTRPNTKFDRVTNIVTNVNSVYNAAVLQLNRRMTNGVQFQTSYTWSHAVDGGQNSQTFTTGNALYDVKKPDLDYGTSNFDIRHKFVASVVYSPTFKFENGVLKAVMNNWTLSPIVNIASGRPYTESIGSALRGLTNTGAATITSLVSGTSATGSGGSSRMGALLARNSFRLPNTYNVDMRLSRRLQIVEGHKLEFLAEAFNLFNHLNVTNVNNRMYNYDSATNKLTYVPTFGTPNEAGNTIYRERQIQFAVRYEF